MGTGTINATTVDAFIAEIWSKEIIYSAGAATVFGNLVRRDFDGEIQAFGDKVKVPVISNVTVGDKSDDTDVVYTNYTEATVDVTIDKHKYFAYVLEDKAKIQSVANLMTSYATQGGAALGREQDTDIATLIQDATVTQNVGAILSAGAEYTDITDAVIRNAIQLLDEANAPDQDRYLVISPEQKNALLGIDKFVKASDIGDNTVIRKGLFGELYGVLVYVSNNLPDVTAVASSGGASRIIGRKSCMMFQRNAFALCTQMDARLQSGYSITKLGDEVVGDTLYGVGVLVAAFAVEVRTTIE